VKETTAIEPATKPPTKPLAKAHATAAAKPESQAAAKPAAKATAASAAMTGTAPAGPTRKRPTAARTVTPASTASAPTTDRAAPSAGLPKRPRLARKAGAKSPLDLARRIVALAEDKKAADILLLDLAGLTTVADAFVICSGGSERQLESIADGIIRGMRDEGIRPIGREGLPASHWILVDFGDVIVHVFTPPERDYYGLEKHWSEAKAILRVQ